MTADEIVATITQQRSERLHELDYPGEWTLRQKETYAEETAALDRRLVYVLAIISTFTNGLIDVQNCKSTIAYVNEWKTYLLKWRTQLADELLTVAQHTPKSRMQTEQEQDLKLSIISIDRGLQILPGAIAYSLRSTRLAQLMTHDGFTRDPDAEELRKYGGYNWRGSLKDVEAELKKVADQLVHAEYVLECARADHDRLLASYSPESEAVPASTAV